MVEQLVVLKNGYTEDDVQKILSDIQSTVEELCDGSACLLRTTRAKTFGTTTVPKGTYFIPVIANIGEFDKLVDILNEMDICFDGLDLLSAHQICMMDYEEIDDKKDYLYRKYSVAFFDKEITYDTLKNLHNIFHNSKLEISPIEHHYIVSDKIQLKDGTIIKEGQYAIGLICNKVKEWAMKELEIEYDPNFDPTEAFIIQTLSESNLGYFAVAELTDIPRDHFELLKK